MKYDALLFDLDGTLLDTLGDLYTAVNAALSSRGFPLRSIDEVRQFVGNGAATLITRAVPEGTPNAECRLIYDAFVSYYAAHCTESTQPYAGISCVLDAVRARGVKTAIVSNKDDLATRKLAAHFFPGLFDVVYGNRVGVKRKPAPDAVLEVLARFSLSADRAVYIGDSDVDIATARAAGMPCISVLWGFRDEAFLRAHGATLTVQTPGELLCAVSER
ncbi:MAG: HAD family hydrolase [Treponema sp.]|nr:HAD family hydrolase [Treponema sp.]